MIMKRFALLGAATAVLAGCSKLPSNDADSNAAASNSAAATPAAATRVRGVLQSINADSLALTTYDGRSVTVPIGKDTKFAWVVGSSLASLKSGDFVGTATTGPDNALSAVELVIFPDAMRAVRERVIMAGTFRA